MNMTHAALGKKNRAQGGYTEALVGTCGAAAGLTCYKPDSDLGFDRILESPSGEAIRLQIKSTASELTVVKNDLRYELDIDAYDRLRKPLTIRSYLILVEVRKHQRDWGVAMDWGYIFRRRAHYLSLRGSAPTNNTTSVTVSIPLANVVTPSTLASLVDGGA